MSKLIISSLFSFLYFFFLFSLSLEAKVDKSTEYCSSGIVYVECRKIEIRTNFEYDGRGDWFKSSDTYQFKSTNGKSCKVKGFLINITDKTNAKLVQSITYVNKRAEWSMPGLLVEQINEGEWKYDISWRFVCTIPNF